MSKKPYIPAQYNSYPDAYVAGWRDAEAGRELGSNAPTSDYQKEAYEAGYMARADRFADEFRRATRKKGGRR